MVASKQLKLTIPVVLLLALAADGGCASREPAPQRLAATLQQLLALEQHATSAPAPFQEILFQQPGRDGGWKAVDELYARRGHRLIWTDASGDVAPRAEALLASLHRANEHGLAPQDYEVDRLQALARDIGKGGFGERAATRAVNFDLLATSALFRYASDLSIGRIRSKDMQPGWHLEPVQLDLSQALDDAVERADPGTVSESLAPPHAGYARLRGALERLRAVEASGGWPVVPLGEKLQTGSRGSRVHQLRERLAREGLAAGQATTTTEERFDPQLRQVVRRFQALYGLEPDGVAGDSTIRELNVPVADRIRQVELNLERWRWIPRELESTHVLVNIPAFELELVRPGSPPWCTRVVAGTAETPTPVFRDRIVAVVVHPPWNVPESIAVNEYLPELRRDRDALERRSLRLLQGSGDKQRELDPKDIDWKSVDAEHFPYHLRQEPGETNPLGQVKFDLTNDFHIYLHDTPGAHVFGRSERDLSHGCVRVERALELANEIASDARRDEIAKALDDPQEHRVQLDARIPVYVLYWTAWADESGELHFGPDVYGFDGPQLLAVDRSSRKSSAIAAALGSPVK